MIKLREYADNVGKRPFADWLSRLRDMQGKARIIKRLARVQAGLLGDWKAVGDGVIELREDHGPGYRIYAGKHGQTLIVLLIGGDKRSQNRDIEHAKHYWKDWKNREA